MRTVKLLEVGESVETKFTEQAKNIETPFILRAMGVLSKADVEYKASKNQRLLVELAIMQICSIKNELEKKKD
jgi:DNA polymerase-3 subunit gamma/tau